MLDDQSFELLLSKLDSLEEGQARIELSLTKRLDEHNQIFLAHTEEDKKLAEHIMAVEKEVTFAKGVTYAVNAMSAGAAWFFGWSKH
jgi:hypothetical protein